MYLSVHRFIGEQYEHRNVEFNHNYKVNDEELKLDMPVDTVVMKGIYWRKANQIHGWFVNNVQDGEDDCREYFVEKQKVKELLDLIKRILKDRRKEKAMELMPPKEGFFFGTYEIDSYYWEDLERTERELEELLDKIDQNLPRDHAVLKVSLNPADGRLLSWLYEHGLVLSREDLEDGTMLFETRLSHKDKSLLERQLHGTRSSILD